MIMRIRNFFLLAITLPTLANSNTPCDCHQIENWTELRSLIMSESIKSKDDNIQVDLPLCPFNIGKSHDANLDNGNWNEIVYMSSAIHVYCKKTDPSDICAITILSDECEANINCGRQLFKIMSDDIWLQGIEVYHAKDVVVNVDKGVQNAKLIDMKFLGGTVPDGDEPKSIGVVMTESGSNLEVLNSSFIWNDASAIYSRGTLVVYDSFFRGNRGSKYFKKGGAILSRGEAVISKSSFIQNWAAPGGYALYSNNEHILDAGGNCFKSKHDLGCQGVHIKDDCFPFLGEDTLCALDE